LISKLINSIAFLKHLLSLNRNANAMNSFETEKTAELGGTIKCSNCAANLKFKPGTSSLICDYCQTLNTIEEKAAEIIENDYHTFLKENGSGSAQQELTVCKCSSCGASTTLPPNITSSSCPYCDTPLIIQNASTCSIIQPKYLLPFKINRNEAKDKFTSWVKGLWFAPSKLKDYAAHSAEKLNGMYMPFWTYDSDTTSGYTGMRGDHYYVTESYRDANGNSKTRQVRKTRWSSASGTVYNKFDDVLVCASASLPSKLTHALEPWDLHELKEYNNDYLAGFLTESYQLNLEAGFDSAKNIMHSSIQSSVRNAIGGDEQQISSINTSYNNISFKHILLPLWISAYQYKDKTYRFVINARTGEVQGERPYSIAKIMLLILAVLAVITAIILFADYKNTSNY
jgi:LSD1 subclass zinc finger protein